MTEFFDGSEPHPFVRLTGADQNACMIFITFN
jgi:hypothetical protein